MQISTQSKQVIQLSSEDFYKALHAYLQAHNLDVSYEDVEQMRIVKSRSDITGTLEFETKSVKDTSEMADHYQAEADSSEPKVGVVSKPVETIPEVETETAAVEEEEVIEEPVEPEPVSDIGLDALDQGKIPDITKTTEVVQPAGGRTARPLFGN